MYENSRQKILPRRQFVRRLVRNFIIGVVLIVIALAGGMWGYHYFEGMGWNEAYVNAAMILSGMGPVGDLKTEAGKFFAGTYALFSGIFFLVIIAIIFAPVFHRFFHKFHLADDKEKDK